MNALAWLARRFGMTDEAWRRHANPWSVWTRFAAIPAMILAIRSNRYRDRDFLTMQDGISAHTARLRRACAAASPSPIEPTPDEA
jgi:hypothetical protein